MMPFPLLSLAMGGEGDGGGGGLISHLNRQIDLPSAI